METTVGSSLRARDRHGWWCDAKIVAQRGEGEAREVKIHVSGFGPRYDEWMQATPERLAPHDGTEKGLVKQWGKAPGLVDAEDSQFDAVRIHKKRSRDDSTEYLVEFCGYEEKEWVPLEDVDEALIIEFEERRRPPAAGPYVLTQPDVIAPEVADELVVEWGEDVGRKSAALLARQREEFACRQLFAMSPCPPWLFRALQRFFLKRATSAFDGARMRYCYKVQKLVQQADTS